MARTATISPAESIRTLRWTLDVWLPHEIAATNHARRLASLRRQREEAKAELARLTALPYCSDCFERANKHEPDMGDEDSTFEPGTCTSCGRDAIVFTLTIGA